MSGVIRVRTDVLGGGRLGTGGGCVFPTIFACPATFRRDFDIRGLLVAHGRFGPGGWALAEAMVADDIWVPSYVSEGVLVSAFI
jgi:hypothetical protein